jgi:alpha-L-arabinofuranosidase
VKHILGAFGYLGKIRIAFDEWNLRGWHHPHVDSATEDYLTPRDKNDINSSYTMADAVFSASFLNQCLRHCDVVGMANFAPTVNTRGAIFAYKGGIVLRPTYFVFDLYANKMGDQVIDSWLESTAFFEAPNREGKSVAVPTLDVVATRHSGSDRISISIVNRSPDETIPISLMIDRFGTMKHAVLYTLNGTSKDSYNDIDQPDAVRVTEEEIAVGGGNRISLTIEPHSVNVLTLSRND